MFCYCMTSFVMYTLIPHAQEPMKLLHLYKLLPKVNTYRVEICTYVKNNGNGIARRQFDLVISKPVIVKEF